VLLFADQNKIIAGTTPILAARIKKKHIFAKKHNIFAKQHRIFAKKHVLVGKTYVFLLFELHPQGTAPSKSPLVPFAPSAPAPKAARRGRGEADRRA